MLKIQIPDFYKVKRGQTLSEIAAAFCVAERALVKENSLKEPPFEGQILRIPKERGNAYFATFDDSKTLLCGSEENFCKKNGTAHLYAGMRVIL